MRKAVYPGSFDPVTMGHLDIIRRAASMCEILYVAVLDNPSKHPLFTTEERVDLIRKSTGDISNLQIETFRGLLIDYAESRDAKLIVRGLRAVSDYEYELQMALANKALCPGIETIFLVANTTYSFLSSSLVKELAMHACALNDLVPEPVANALREKMMRR